MSTQTVLIVEDDESIRTLYTMALETAGLKVLEAENGKLGVEMALLHHPDAILMDIMMPVMGGHEAIQKIRLDSWGKNASVVFLTNLSDAENVVHAIEEGGEAYIVKANTSVKEVVNKVRIAMHT